MRKIIIAGLAALALVGGAADAQAFDWNETKSETFREYVSGDTCASPGYVDIGVAGSARDVEVVTPLLGQQIQAEDFFYGNSGPVQVTEVVSDLGWTMQPVGDWCSSFESDDGWETDSVKFSVRYRIRKRLVMTRNLARNLTEQAFYRRFSWYDDANHAGWRCRISGNRGRCRHVFGIGDGAVIGVVKVRLIGRNGRRPVWSYTLNALQIDELCAYVTHLGDCTTRTKKRRNRISLPYWVQAKKI